MCCFSGPVFHVSRTRIFARPLPGGRQRLVYSMTVAAPSEVAMVLPLPVPPDAPDDAVSFVDLSGHPRFFDELESLFPRMVSGAPAPAARPAFAAPQPLVVHRVGSFDASFVPRPSDFSRLDARFRLPPGVWDALPDYADWGFAVFVLRAEASAETEYHPMGLDFPRRDSARVFFPTVHVHDGTVHASARFDHDLFCQLDGEDRRDGWTASARRVVESLCCPSFVHLDAERHVHRRSLAGELPNQDVWI